MNKNVRKIATLFIQSIIIKSNCLKKIILEKTDSNIECLEFCFEFEITLISLICFSVAAQFFTEKFSPNSLIIFFIFNFNWRITFKKILNNEIN